MKTLLISACILLLVGCGKEAQVSTLPDPTPDQKLNENESGLSLTLIENTFTKSPITIETHIRNDSSIDYQYGQFYHIEVKMDGLWYLITYSDAVFIKNKEFIDTGNTLRPGEEVQQLFSVDMLGVTLVPGEYRLAKTFLSLGDRFHEITVAASFWVK
ncbi:immunoglobulin-like domain-containing protein [Sporosarcina siberiensis]|uniref:Immunoglobulin-like domain-containing protein n=1 Tax=Sporosarcina siberiensis TaxID=1365606 RepID=A0ABW4SKM7_9BACL